jgi:hypothetical protein
MTEPKIISAVSVASANATVSATATVRTNFAAQHLLGVARFARQAWSVEQANSGEPFGQFFEELIHLVTATVTISVASLEAFGNELFADGRKRFPSLSNEVIDTTWALAGQRPFMDKYALALTLHAAVPFDRGNTVSCRCVSKINFH